MTDRIALALGLLLAAVIAVDVGIFGARHIVFLGKKLVDLIEWTAFWR
jgi:hypothetical protein